ncbi:MAG: hypothetical protein OEM29_04910, partial [Thermoplasmata archaeon]|nr:hypothetical protein [Thermoplasmata archaeon]
MSRLIIEFSNGLMTVVELRSGDTPTVDALKNAVPFAASASRWGDEVYFETPASATLEDDAREV